MEHIENLGLLLKNAQNSFQCDQAIETEVRAGYKISPIK